MGFRSVLVASNGSSAAADLLGEAVAERYLDPGGRIVSDDSSSYGAILETQERIDVDLVVVDGRESIVSGRATTFAVRIAQYSRCPVLAYRSSDRTGRVLAASDLSDPSFTAAEVGAGVARAWNGSFSLVHVLDAQPPLGPLDAGEPTYERAARARAWLNHAIGRTGGGRGTAAVLQGPVVPTISGHAAAEGSELIVVATRGWTRVGRILFGSVSEEILLFAPCSVLVARR